MFEDFIDEILYYIEVNKKKVLLSILLLLILSPWFFYIYANYTTQDSKSKVQKTETNSAKIDRSTRNKNSNIVNKVIVPNNEKTLVWSWWLANLSATWLTDLSSSWAIKLTSTWLTNLSLTWVPDLTWIWLLNRNELNNNWFTEEDLFLIKKYNLMKKIDKYNTVQKINKIKNLFSKSTKTNTSNNTIKTNEIDTSTISNTWTIPNTDSWKLININKEILANPGSWTLNIINVNTSPIIDSWTISNISTWILSKTESLLTPYDLEEYFNNEAYYNIWNWIFKKIKTLVNTADNAIDLTAKTCEDWYFELWKYSNITELNTIVLPYSNSLNNLEITEEFLPLYLWTSYNYKVFNINGIKSWAVASETSNTEETINWIFTLCVQN